MLILHAHDNVCTARRDVGWEGAVSWMIYSSRLHRGHEGQGRNSGRDHHRVCLRSTKQAQRCPSFPGAYK